MHLWNAAALARALGQGDVTEREKLGYLLTGIVLQSFGRHYSLLEGIHYPIVLATVVPMLAITVGGIILTFRANARGDGRLFLERYVCLSVPLLIRVYVAYGCVALAMWFLVGRCGNPMRPAGTLAGWALWALGFVLLIWFFAALRRHVGDAAAVTASPTTAEA
ncbi:MAG TPA: hypothetical protein VF041_00085 [Gemmatimonadaceae bacterium]